MEIETSESGASAADTGPGELFDRLAAAGSALISGDSDVAAEHFGAALDALGDSDAAMLGVLDGLRAVGDPTDVLRVLGPRYRPGDHHPDIGLSLLRAAVIVGNPDAVAWLADELRGLGDPAVSSELAELLG